MRSCKAELWQRCSSKVSEHGALVVRGPVVAKRVWMGGLVTLWFVQLPGFSLPHRIYLLACRLVSRLALITHAKFHLWQSCAPTVSLSFSVLVCRPKASKLGMGFLGVANTNCKGLSPRGHCLSSQLRALGESRGAWLACRWSQELQKQALAAPGLQAGGLEHLWSPGLGGCWAG